MTVERERESEREHKMEEWIPLFDIFLKSPLPETEASQWLDQASNSSSSSSSTAAPINRSSFVSLLKKQCDQHSSPAAKKVLFIETLPNMVQSKILSFLLFEYRRFCVSDLVWLGREMLGGGGGSKVVDFWVHRDAQNLLDRIPKPKFDWISHLDLDSAVDDSMREEFDSVPDWLSEKVGSAGTILPWLPVSSTDVDSEMLVVDSWNGKEMSLSRENMEEDHREVVDSIDHTMNVGLQADDHEMAMNLRAQITSFESTSEVLTLCNEIRKFCLEKGRDSLRVLALIEPWNADDETAAVFLSNLHSGSEEDELGWPSQVLCSILLPRFLAVEKSASRVLMSATIEFCKIHQRAAEYALVFPLILRKEGINNFICEVIARVLKECLHLGQISGFCQKLLCGRIEERRFMFLPCHRDLISDELTWNESLFILFQNILIHDVPLSQDSVDCLVSKVQELAERYSKSLKFGNFLLHFIAKCAPMLHAHKYQLVEAVKCTNSLVTKSILSKLNSL